MVSKEKTRREHVTNTLCGPRLPQGSDIQHLGLSRKFGMRLPRDGSHSEHQALSTTYTRCVKGTKGNPDVGA